MSRPRGRPPTATSALVPAAARGETAFGDVEAALNVDAIERFAQAVGGRDVLADTLAVAGVGHEVERITTLLLDPRYASWSLSRLCSLVGITVADLFAAYRKAGIAKAHVEASYLIARKLKPIVDDVMTRAAPQRRLCGGCLGIAAEQAVCKVCDQTGYIQSEPDLDRQKLALELGQLLEKKGGILVQQNNMAAQLGATAPGALEQLQQAVGDLLFGDKRQPQPFNPDVIVPAPDPAHRDDDLHEVNGDTADLPDLPFEQPDSPPRRPERSDPPTSPERP